MLNLARRIRFENLRSLAFGSISGAYAIVGTAFANPVRLLKVVNNTDTNLIISYDGVNDKDYVAAHSQFIYDYGSDASNQGDTLEQSAGQAVHVKNDGIAATTGKVYVVVMYASTN